MASRRSTLGARFKSARLKARLRQVDVAKRAGISQEYLAHLETGRYYNPTIKVLVRLSKVLGISVVSLLNDVDMKPTPRTGR